LKAHSRWRSARVSGRAHALSHALPGPCVARCRLLHDAPGRPAPSAEGPPLDSMQIGIIHST
jgi:hypothetical protein